MNKRVLIITYYWPPSGGSGVQRWLKFAKYLPEFGWDPVIFTPENPDFDIQDHSLLDEIPSSIEIMKFPIWEPYGLFRKLKQQSGSPAKILENKKKSWRDMAGIWLRANALIPDPRVFWKKPSVSFLSDLIKNGQFDAMITTGPPHSLHLIGLDIKKKTGLAWLADFRDPWSTWEFLDSLPMMDWVRKRHKILEKQVLHRADTVTTISPTFQQDLSLIAERPIDLLTNGFDESDLPQPWEGSPASLSPIEILYTGVIDAIRNPIPFLEAFKIVFSQGNESAMFRFVGVVSEPVKEFIANDIWLSAHVRLEGYKHHHEVFEYYRRARLLVLILTDTKNAKGNIPGKLFEYMSTGRPIVALGDPNGDAAHILHSANAGRVFFHQDSAGLQSFLSDFRSYPSGMAATNISQYSRRNLTKKLAQLLDEKTRPLS